MVFHDIPFPGWAPPRNIGEEHTKWSRGDTVTLMVKLSCISLYLNIYWEYPLFYLIIQYYSRRMLINNFIILHQYLPTI